LQAAHEQSEAKLEFHRALDLDPNSTQARAGLLSLRGEPRHELRVGATADLFSFTDANHDEGLSLTSQWTSRWGTSVAGNAYRAGERKRKKFVASVTGRLPRWGELTLGGGAAHDNNVIPKNEAFFYYDRGWKVSGSKVLREWKSTTGSTGTGTRRRAFLRFMRQHSFICRMTWTWCLGLTGARAIFRARNGVLQG